LLEHGVDERRLPVVDVGNDGDVAYFAGFHLITAFVMNLPWKANS